MAHLFKRGKRYYLKYYVGGKQKEKALATDNHQLAREKQRQFESALARGDDNPLPTKTPIAQVLAKYVDHIRATKTPKSAQSDIYYLREAFGPCCDALRCTSRRLSPKARKRPSNGAQPDGRRKLPVIDAACFEQITTAQVAEFIAFKVRDQGIAPKTANHYRSILRRVFNWAEAELGLKLPNGKNPAAAVRPYRERAPEIRYLTLPQIDEQLRALRFKPQLQTMVAVLIYAGLRREELLWLTADDLTLPKTGGGLIQVRAKTIGGESWQPKTRTNRAVPISQQLRAYLDRYTRRPSDGRWLFPSPQGGRWDPDNFSADLRDTNGEHGLPWTALDFRHTFGSHIAQKGVSLYTISQIMGNSPDICRRHYAALVPEPMAAEVDFLLLPETA